MLDRETIPSTISRLHLSQVVNIHSQTEQALEHLLGLGMVQSIAELINVLLQVLDRNVVVYTYYKTERDNTESF